MHLFNYPAVIMTMAFSMITPVLFGLSVDDFDLPAQDEEGWTVLVPHAESRLVYVDSEEGNDSTGQIYAVGDAAIGEDPQAPTGNVLAFKTLAAAYGRTRVGQPDWMLLRAGRVWENQSLQLRRGLSATARFVVCPYGEGARPELRTGSRDGISGNRATNVAVIGIKFWAHTRDPDGAYYTSTEGGDGFLFLNQAPGAADQVRNVLMEDCYFRSYQLNRISGRTESNNSAPVERFVMRRSIVSGYYQGFSIGFNYTATGQPQSVPPAVLLEENLFYHNGWLVRSGEGGQGQAVITNHNTYLSDVRNVLFKGNFFLSASSIGNKWTGNGGADSAGPVVMEDNFYYGGELGISAGGNNAGPLRFTGFEIRNNVFSDIGKERPTNRNLAWYIEVQDWDGGEISGNLMLNQTQAGLNNVYAISISANNKTNDVLIANNIVYNIETGNGASGQPLILLQNVGNVTNVEFSNNVVQAVDGAPPIGLGGFGGYSFSGVNSYYSSRPANSIFRFESASIGLDLWRLYTGNPEAIVAAPDWEDPDRNVERYVQELGLGSTFDDFIEVLHLQSKSNWRADLTAPGVNDWFRAGFVSPTLTPDTWGPFSRDENGNVDTESLLGEIHAPAEWENWIWVRSMNKYFYLPEDHVSEEGAWAWAPLFLSGAAGADWAYWTPTADGWVSTDVDSASRFIGMLNVAHTPWVYSLLAEQYIYLPETLVQEAGAWFYLFR